MWTGACVSVKTLGKEIAIYNVNSYTSKTASSYWEGTERPLVPEGFTINSALCLQHIHMKLRNTIIHLYPNVNATIAKLLLQIGQG